MVFGYKCEISKPAINYGFQQPIQFVENVETREGITSYYKGGLEPILITLFIRFRLNAPRRAVAIAVMAHR